MFAFMHTQRFGRFHRPVLRCPLPSARSDAGFTLIEVLVSALMVVLIGSATATALISGSHSSGSQRLRSQADELAQQDQERLKGISDQQLNGLNQVAARLAQLDGTSFTITSTATYLSSTGGSSCSSTTGDTAYYKILSDVSWTSNRLSDVKEESVIARPVGGNLLIQVTDETNAGLQGATVSTTGPSVQSAVTDSLGCATFSGLVAGNYTVTVTDPGYIDQTGSNSPSTTMTVPTSLLATPIALGRAATIAANFTTQAIAGTPTCPPTTGLCTGQQADALSWYGSSATNKMPGPASYGLAAPGSQIPVSTTLQLFPFPKSLLGVTPVDYTANYQVWAGKCAGMQPPTTPTPYDAFSILPASSQIVAVQEPALAVFLTYNAVRVAPTDVKISFSSTTATPCSDSWSAPIASDAATDLNGSLAFPGQPYASSTAPLKICADYKPSALLPYVSNSSALISTPNANFSAPTAVTVALLTTSSQSKC
jgi:type II secretory pathway pseudopilin PulG